MQEQNLTMKQAQSTCRRCGTGTMLLHNEMDGPEMRCIQCGGTAVLVNGLTAPAP